MNTISIKIVYLTLPRKVECW